MHATLRGMLACIEQHVLQRPPHLRRRRQDPHVEAMIEQLTLAPEAAVDPQREPGGQRTHA
ncbi:MAG TPA: hypothetical protein VG755_34980 [Nannocystaceae bacterium]|nr:hypothetical protein [Nannocystaceae bacterium]